jgi:hypothetical protein
MYDGSLRLRTGFVGQKVGLQAPPHMIEQF